MKYKMNYDVARIITLCLGIFCVIFGFIACFAKSEFIPFGIFLIFFSGICFFGFFAPYIRAQKHIKVKRVIKKKHNKDKDYIDWSNVDMSGLNDDIRFD